MTSMSRRMIINAVPSVEQIVRNDLSAVIANEIDVSALLGNGTSNSPTGIVNTTGVRSQSFAAGASWEKVLEMIAEVQHENVLGPFGWAMNAYAVKRFRGTVKHATAGVGYIMESPTELAGYPVGVTSNLPGNSLPNSPTEVGTVIGGAFEHLLVCNWTSGIDILANPFETTAFAKGRVIVRAMKDVNVAVRHTGAFIYSNDVPLEAA